MGGFRFKWRICQALFKLEHSIFHFTFFMVVEYISFYRRQWKANRSFLIDLQLISFFKRRNFYSFLTSRLMSLRNISSKWSDIEQRSFSLPYTFQNCHKDVYCPIKVQRWRWYFLLFISNSVSATVTPPSYLYK